MLPVSFKEENRSISKCEISIGDSAQFNTNTNENGTSENENSINIFNPYENTKLDLNQGMVSSNMYTISFWENDSMEDLTCPNFLFDGNVSNISQQLYNTSPMMMGYNQNVTENDVLINAKESREKLMMSHDKLKDKLNSIMNKMSESETEHDRMKYSEIFKEVKVSLGRCELGVADSILLMHLAEYLQSLEKSRARLRNETRRLHIDNKKLKINAAEALGNVFKKEAQLVTVTEEKKHWISMCEIAKLHEATQIVDEENDMWDDTIFPDTLWETGAPEEMEDLLKGTYDKISEYLASGKVLESLACIHTYYANKAIEDVDTTSVSANEAVLLTKVAKVCTDQGYLTDALELLEQCYKLRVTAFGESHKLVIGTLNNKAIIYWKLNQMKKAASAAFGALKLMEKSVKNIGQNPDIAKQYLRTGFLMTKWGYTEDGLKLMELAAMTFENLLPKEEDNWMRSVVKLARACNDNKAYEDAMCVCCELIDYFHQKRFGPISPTNRTIYEIAADQQDSEADGKKVSLIMPPAIYLPATVVSALRELAIVFSSYYLFTAAKVIDKWIELCMGTADYYNIVEKAHQRVYEILGKEKKITGAIIPQEMTETDSKESYGKVRKRTIHLDGGSMKVISNENKGITEKSQKGLMKQMNTRLNTIFKSKGKNSDDEDENSKPVAEKAKWGLFSKIKK